MNKKPLIIILVVIAAISLAAYFLYFSKPKTLSEEEKIEMLDQLSSQSRNNFTEQEKMDILNGKYKQPPANTAQ